MVIMVMVIACSVGVVACGDGYCMFCGCGGLWGWLLHVLWVGWPVGMVIACSVGGVACGDTFHMHTHMHTHSTHEVLVKYKQRVKIVGWRSQQMLHVVEIRKEQMQVSVISSEEEVQLHATEVLIPNQSVISSWSDAYRFNHAAGDVTRRGFQWHKTNSTIKSCTIDGRVMCCSRNKNLDCRINRYA